MQPIIIYPTVRLMQGGGGGITYLHMFSTCYSIRLTVHGFEDSMPQATKLILNIMLRAEYFLVRYIADSV